LFQSHTKKNILIFTLKILMPTPRSSSSKRRRKCMMARIEGREGSQARVRNFKKYRGIQRFMKEKT
jgi:hypothetical protein